jgi:hypothetical protein
MICSAVKVKVFSVIAASSVDVCTIGYRALAVNLIF